MRPGGAERGVPAGPGGGDPIGDIVAGLQTSVSQPTLFLERLVRAAMNQVGARFGGLVVVPPEGPYLRQVVSVDVPVPIVDSRIERTQGLAPRVLQGRPVVTDAYASARPPDLVGTLPPIGPMGLWPFVHDGRVFAYLQAFSVVGEPPFDRAACDRVTALVERLTPLLPAVLALRQSNRGFAVYDAGARLLDGLRRVHDTEQLARRAVDGLAAALGLGQGVLVLNAPGDEFEIPGRAEPVRLTPLERAAVNERRLVIGPGRETNLGVDREVAVVPLVTGEAVLGVLVVAQRSSIGHFWPEELGWLERFASRVALGVQYLRDREAQAGRIEAYRRLLEGVRLISAEHELDEVLERLVEVAMSACDAHVGAVHMLDAESGLLRLRTVSMARRGGPQPLPVETRPGEGVVGRAFAESRTVRARGGPERGENEFPPPGVAAVAAPIRVGDDRVGVLTLTGIARGPLWTAATADHLELVAAHAGTAVAAARRIEVLRSVEAALRRHVTEVEAFAYTVSHDLRTPVVSISGLANVLLEDHGEELPDEVRDLAERIRRAADHLALLSSDLLDYSRLGREGHRPAAVSVGDMLRHALQRFGDRLRRRGLTVEAPDDDARVWVVPAHLARIIDNALANALRFVCDDEGARLRVTLEGDEEWVVLRFDDNGPGIPPDQRDRVFELFRRADRRSGDTGIGLSAVRRCAELAGGNAWIEDGRLGGCGLCVRLPRAEAVLQRPRGG